MPLRFTIRDLLWLTVVVALAVGWWLDHNANRYVPYAGRANDGIYRFKPPFSPPADSKPWSALR